MTRYGYLLSCEEYGPAELVRQARLAEEAGFGALWISGHFHPWLDEQGQAGHVWSLIGARACTKAGFDGVYIGQVGGEAEGFFEFYATQVLPRLREG